MSVIGCSSLSNTLKLNDTYVMLQNALRYNYVMQIHVAHEQFFMYADSLTPRRRVKSKGFSIVSVCPGRTRAAGAPSYATKSLTLVA